MSFAEELAADRRLVMLRALFDAPGNAINEGVGKTIMGNFGHKVGGDIVRADLQFLADHGLVRLEKLARDNGSDFWVAHLTLPGEDVAAGRRVHPGVARRGPE